MNIVRSLFIGAIFLSLSTISSTQTLNPSTIRIQSRILGEMRTVFISVPRNYISSTKRYPVLYVLDGEWAFNYAAGAVDQLSNFSGRIPQMIVIGIPNTDRSRDLFVTPGPNGSYKHFMRFIESELIPIINRRFRTNGFNVINGFSSGSGICEQFLATKPSVFDGYIETGSGIGPGTADFLSKTIPLHNYKNKYLYVTTESSGPRVKGLHSYSALLNKLKPNGLRWRMEILEDTNHADVMADGIYAGLKYIYTDYSVPKQTVLGGLSSIVSYFEKIDSNFNYEVEIPAAAFIEMSVVFLTERKTNEAIKLLELGIKTHPRSPDLYGALAELFEETDRPKAAQFYGKAAEDSKGNRALNNKYLTMQKKMETPSMKPAGDN